MHSLKNTVVAVALLAVSFGLYQVSLTEKPEIDPGLIPAIDISDGMGSDREIDLVSADQRGLIAAPDTVAKSRFPELPSTTADLSASFSAGSKLTVPDLSQPPIQPSASGGSPAPTDTATTSEPSANRKPLTASVENNVQSIQYPKDFAASENPPPRSASNQTEIAQRELVSPSIEQGLIEALKNEKKRQPELAQNDSFQSNPRPPAAESSAAGPLLARPPAAPMNNQFAAQPIGASKTEFDTTATEMVSATAPISSESEAGLDANFDAQVQQAHGEPLLKDLDFNAAWPQVDQFVASGDYSAALKLLSRFYRDPTLTGPQRQRLLGWLDALAGKVIFSEENHLSAHPYTVGDNESLADIASRWSVPAQLILNVNKTTLPNSGSMQSGMNLKPIPGPFQAEINLQAKVMTLFLGDLYAGRFPIMVGISGQPKPGTFKVLLKSASGFIWRDSEGVEYQPGSPQNGYGPNWIGLSGSLCIHSVAAGTVDGHHGCIGLNADDAADVFAILAENSEIKIVR